MRWLRRNRSGHLVQTRPPLSRLDRRREPAIRPVLESLEDRLLMAVTATYIGETRLLDIQVTGRESIEVTSEGGSDAQTNLVHVRVTDPDSGIRILLVEGGTGVGRPGQEFRNGKVVVADVSQILIQGDNDNDNNFFEVIGGVNNNNFTVTSITLMGGGGNDKLRAPAFRALSNDLLLGGPGNDTLTGGLGDDTLDGGDGSDILEQEFFNTFDASRGNDLLIGGPGDDSITSELGQDTIRGGPGRDTVFLLNGLITTGTQPPRFIEEEPGCKDSDLVHVLSSVNLTTNPPRWILVQRRLRRSTAAS